MKQRLTTKKVKFCHEYLEDRNGARAAFLAGYKKEYAHITACNLLKQKVVRDYLNSLAKKKQEMMLVDSIACINELCKTGFSNIAMFLDESGSIRNLNELPTQALAAIKKLNQTSRFDKEGNETKTKTIELHDKHKSLELLMKQMGELKEIVEHRVEYRTKDDALAAMARIDEQIDLIANRAEDVKH
jgi:hypothetical protein